MGSGKARLPVLDRVYGRTPGLRTRAPYTHEAVRVPMRDGAPLAADHYAPSGEALGTLLVRGPYGRGVMLAMTLARVFAARGYHVLFDSSRGTAGSEGVFDPMRTDPPRPSRPCHGASNLRAHLRAAAGSPRRPEALDVRPTRGMHCAPHSPLSASASCRRGTRTRWEAGICGPG